MSVFLDTTPPDNLQRVRGIGIRLILPQHQLGIRRQLLLDNIFGHTLSTGEEQGGQNHKPLDASNSTLRYADLSIKNLKRKMKLQ